jgi:hypothetical protein
MERDMGAERTGVFFSNDRKSVSRGATVNQRRGITVTALGISEEKISRGLRCGGL